MESGRNQENNHIKIMVIEDDPNLVSLITTLLDLEGFNVSAPQNHYRSNILEIFHTHRPHVALVDANLAGGSGLDLVSAIRAEPGLEDTCILMTSGMNLKKECLQSGADAFIQKPFMPDELISLINKSYKPTITNQK
jgi:DNA-binding response OmpR family regulator